MLKNLRSNGWGLFFVIVCSGLCYPDERPNILFIMSDDHTTQAIGAYATLLRDLDPTPTIDRLAREGICFDNAFCTNSICTPSRACIITGQYNHINGVFDLGGRILPSRQTLPVMMREAASFTAVADAKGAPMQGGADAGNTRVQRLLLSGRTRRVTGWKPLSPKLAETKTADESQSY